MRTYWVVVGVLVAGCGSEGAGANGEHGDATAPTEATLVMQPFTVEPGGEVFVCQTFANPFGNAFVREFETHMSTGSHHLIVNYASVAPSNRDIRTLFGAHCTERPLRDADPG
jgi:hypothetical protein